MSEEDIFKFIYAVYTNSLRYVSHLVDKNILRYAEIGTTRPDVYKLKFNPKGFKEITGYVKTLGKSNRMVSNNKSIKAFDKVLEFTIRSAYYKGITSKIDEFELKIIKLLTECIVEDVINCKQNEGKEYIDILNNLTYKTIINRAVTNICFFFTNGIYIGESKCEIVLGNYILRIRRPSYDDLNRLFAKFNAASIYASTVEIEFNSNEDIHEYGVYFEEIATVLKLYGCGDIYYQGYQVDSYFITKNRHYASCYIGNGSSNHKYYIWSIDDFKKKTPILFDKLHSLNLFNASENDSRGYPIKISMDRYFNSLKLKTTENDRIITEIIFGFEALYLRNDNEKNLKLRTRVAQTFKQLNSNCDLDRLFNCSYKIRNAYVHGLIKPLGLKEEFQVLDKELKIVDTLLTFLRLSILLFIFMRPDKKSYIKLVDKSMKDTSKELELRIILGQASNFIAPI